MMKIERLDHLVLTVDDIDRTIVFYTAVLGMQAVTFADNRTALSFGGQKINLHASSNPISPNAKTPTAGSADLCFIAQTPLSEIILKLNQSGVPVELGPVPRTGARGPIMSIYFRDPDGNLIEVANED
jgi:catechol 2,3-dioxygenase-like lactoylglutathione lyase family enzyme